MVALRPLPSTVVLPAGGGLEGVSQAQALALPQGLQGLPADCQADLWAVLPGRQFIRFNGCSWNQRSSWRRRRSRISRLSCANVPSLWSSLGSSFNGFGSSTVATAARLSAKVKNFEFFLPVSIFEKKKEKVADNYNDDDGGNCPHPVSLSLFLFLSSFPH